MENFGVAKDSVRAGYEQVTGQLAISKRAGRRLIQRAFVLVGRDRAVRQHIRSARFATLWVLEDWKFEWTVLLDRGKVLFERRPARRPGLTFAWPNAEEFFQAIHDGRPPEACLRIEGDLHLRRLCEPVYRAFCRLLGQVMRYPFDDAENPLM